MTSTEAQKAAESGSSAKASPAAKRSRRRRILFRLITLGIAFAFAALVAEIAIRIVLPQNLSGTWRTTDANGLFVHQGDHEARHQHGERVVYYRFDGDGLRRLGPEQEGAGQGSTRILCLGDSFTFGWLLADGDTYIAQLQTMADEEFGKGKFELLNGGHGGWGASDYVRFFEEYGSRFAVRGVIVFFNTDDIGRSVRNAKYELPEGGAGELTKITRTRQDSLIKRVANAVPVYPWLLEHSHLVQLSRNAVASRSANARRIARPSAAGEAGDAVPLLESKDQADPDQARSLGRALFKRLKAMASEQSVELLVLTTGFHREGDLSEPTRAFMANAAQILGEEEISFYDCSPELRGDLGEDYSSITIAGDGHPDEAGARRIAELNWPQVRRFLEGIEPTPAGNSDGT